MDARHRAAPGLGTFCKTLAPGLRIDFVVAPQELVARLTALKTARTATRRV